MKTREASRVKSPKPHRKYDPYVYTFEVELKSKENKAFKKFIWEHEGKFVKKDKLDQWKNWGLGRDANGYLETGNEWVKP